MRQIQKALVYGQRSPSVRELMISCGYKSPRSISLILERLEKRKVLKRREDGTLQLLKGLKSGNQDILTVSVPLVGCAPCGLPLLALQNVETTIAVSIRLAKPPHQYFLLRATGDSMNKAGINDGDLVLVKKQESANEGDIVVALIDGEATIKELHYTGKTVTLQPQSNNKSYRSIILEAEFEVQGVVTATISSSGVS